ncbi:hypothetical protein SCAR479_13372, partial [Seiridium cardinale]
LNIR